MRSWTRRGRPIGVRCSPCRCSRWCRCSWCSCLRSGSWCRASQPRVSSESGMHGRDGTMRVRSRISRREFMVLGAAGLTLAAGAACGMPIPGMGGEPKSLSVAQWGTAQRADLYKKAIALFQEQNAGVTADLQFAELGAYNDRLTTQAASKSLPDVIWMRDDRVGRFGGSGALLDLTPYLDKGIDMKGLSKVAAADGTVGKGVYALASHYVGQSIVVNAQYLQEKGVKYDQQVKTWDDLAGLAKLLSDPERKF